jgi:hypothetical protein
VRVDDDASFDEHSLKGTIRASLADTSTRNRKHADADREKRDLQAEKSVVEHKTRNIDCETGVRRNDTAR